MKDNSAWTLCTVSFLDLVLQLLYIVLLYLYGVMTSPSPWHLDKGEVCLSVVEQGQYLKESIWVLLKVGCCCETRPILDSWFCSVTSKSPLQCENQICLFVCFLGHWRENQFKLTWVPVRAVNITFVKDHCHKNSGLDRKWAVRGGNFLLSRRNKARQNKADFDTALLVRHPWGSPKALPTFLQMLEITHQGVHSFTREQSQTLAPKAQSETSRLRPGCVSIVLGLSCLFGLPFLGEQPVRLTSLQWSWTNHNYGRLNKGVEVKAWNGIVLLRKAWFGKASRMFFRSETRSRKRWYNQAYTGQVCFAFYGKAIAVPLGLRLGRKEE